MSTGRSWICQHQDCSNVHSKTPGHLITKILPTSTARSRQPQQEDHVNVHSKIPATSAARSQQQWSQIHKHISDMASDSDTDTDTDSASDVDSDTDKDMNRDLSSSTKEWLDYVGGKLHIMGHTQYIALNTMRISASALAAATTTAAKDVAAEAKDVAASVKDSSVRAVEGFGKLCGITAKIECDAEALELDLSAGKKVREPLGTVMHASMTQANRLQREMSGKKHPPVCL
ncbi:hypothetical protein BDK51DRAFT_32959 [Blyttiomyces helicus]|uniref:Uncharacterized protein n=1 Tax=Blyttiomyces helicus TaxID=388810 RepID=A0A4P9WNE1_9FUNG|nr:hypothetical protein BDK51DRAFT_32959 [Blyttiomyces helicus]|eukprot:RKO94464.1 hypothetical protein BDK51DRAFT_32959 [Blyttiomyces helicus]